MKTTRKRYSADFTAKVALEAIRGDLTLTPGQVDFGVANRSTSPTRELTLSYAGGQADWTIREVKTISDHIVGRLQETGRSPGGQVNYVLTATLKLEGRLSLLARGDGRLKMIMAECTHEHDVRAIARLDEDDDGSGLPDDPGLRDLLGHGTLAITLEPRHGERLLVGIPLPQQAREFPGQGVAHSFTPP